MEKGRRSSMFNVHCFRSDYDVFVCWIFIEEISFSRQKVKNITNVSDHDIHS